MTLKQSHFLSYILEVSLSRIRGDDSVNIYFQATEDHTDYLISMSLKLKFSLLAFVGICLVFISEWPIVSQIVVVLVNRELSGRSVSWPLVRRRYPP